MQYPDDFVNKVVLGNCLEVLKYIPNNSVDAVITDPPYNLVSIKKRWSYKKARETPLINTKEGAVFKRISKGFMGKEWDATGITFNVNLWKECLRVLKPGGYLLSFGGTRTYHRMASAIEDAGFEIKDMLEWIYSSGFPKSLNIANAIAKKEGAKREGARREGAGTRGNTLITAFKKYYQEFTETENSKKYKGLGTGLKPAHEPICMAMKPLSEKNFVENILKWGTGGLSIDECKIPVGKLISINDTNYKENTLGRFPANVLVQDDALNDGEITKSIKSDYNWEKSNNYNPTHIVRNIKSGIHHGDSGSKSRYFDIDKWNEKHGLLQFSKASKSERNMGCEELEDRIGGGMVGTRDKTLLTGSGNIRNNITKNIHPTVKPLKLMLYLVSLVSQEGHIVLDMFAGSGTTGLACKMLKRNYILIEKEAEYVEISKARLSAVQDLLI